MSNFKRPSRDRNERKFSGGGHSKNKFGGRDNGGQKQMFPAKCGDCGDNCEVPFRPTREHPVFCSRCFKGKEVFDSQKPKSFGGDRGGDRNRYPTSRPQTNTGTGVSKAQFASLTEKIDRILSLLSENSSDAPKKGAKKVEVVKIKSEKKVVKKKASKKRGAIKKEIVFD